ncbi:CD225/dispanin family protein [Flavobacterium agricola]|uniref:CD225/dispanin family protein n=1 Tax=Flavobacterium agricola TaxID=2870839 RepID=A0ABY6M1V3_9FLAO|nr:CD225/dispanin family protein [Flavobacterium agricola]UYW02538.1 CD225/dispanin family protein [Flavobacterium agricola]
MEKLSLTHLCQAPNNYMVWACLTLLFFFPLGIIALLKALKVNKLWKKGFYEEAKQTAFFVRVTTIIGLTVGSVTYLSLVMMLSSIYLFAV